MCEYKTEKPFSVVDYTTVMLCYAMLCYVMLCYVMLRYFVLCYVICRNNEALNLRPFDSYVPLKQMFV